MGTKSHAAHGRPKAPPSHPDLPSPPARKEKGRNVLVDVTRRGGSGGWTAGGSDEDRCRLTPSTLTEFVFHGALAEEAAGTARARARRHTGTRTQAGTRTHTTKTETEHALLILSLIKLQR